MATGRRAPAAHSRPARPIAAAALQIALDPGRPRRVAPRGRRHGRRAARLDDLPLPHARRPAVGRDEQAAATYSPSSRRGRRRSPRCRRRRRAGRPHPRRAHHDRPRIVAEYELYLASIRRPQLAPASAAWAAQITRVLERRLDPATAHALTMVADGALMHALATGTDPRRDELVAILRRVIA